MGGWYIYKTDRKTSMQGTRILIIVLIVSALIAIFFPNINKKKAQEKIKTDKAISDTIRNR